MDVIVRIVYLDDAAYKSIRLPLTGFVRMRQCQLGGLRKFPMPGVSPGL